MAPSQNTRLRLGKMKTQAIEGDSQVTKGKTRVAKDESRVAKGKTQAAKKEIQAAKMKNEAARKKNQAAKEKNQVAVVQTSLWFKLPGELRNRIYEEVLIKKTIRVQRRHQGPTADAAIVANMETDAC